MSMPPPRFLCITLGCVAKVVNGPPSVTIAATVANIKTLHPYFGKPASTAATHADEIYGYSFSTTAPGTSVGDLVFTNRSITVPAGCVICDLGPSTSATPVECTTPVGLVKGHCYWLAPGAKKPKKTRSKKR